MDQFILLLSNNNIVNSVNNYIFNIDFKRYDFFINVVVIPMPNLKGLDWYTICSILNQHLSIFVQEM